tara:strand:+ start:15903 stop:17921 length:2019 start_codon:yes stop_codon:yes gene_type:complete
MIDPGSREFRDNNQPIFQPPTTTVVGITVNDANPTMVDNTGPISVPTTPGPDPTMVDYGPGPTLGTGVINPTPGPDPTMTDFPTFTDAPGPAAPNPTMTDGAGPTYDPQPFDPFIPPVPEPPLVYPPTNTPTPYVPPIYTQDPIPENPCIDLHDYGHVLWENKFQWSAEVESFLMQPDVKKVAAFSDIALEWVVKARNKELWPNNNGVGPQGQQYKIICTNYFIRDFLCKVKSTQYFNLQSVDVAFAKFKFNDSRLPHEYYVSSSGKLCRLRVFRDSDSPIDPDLGDPIDPPNDDTIPNDTGDGLGSGNIYSPIYVDDIVRCPEIVTGPLWSQGAKYLATPISASFASDTGSANYCVGVHNLPPTDLCSELQYRCIYADYEGKGDKDLGGRDDETLTKAMYTQYSHILLPKGQDKFIIDGNEEDYVYIVDVKRDRYKQIMDPGNWQLSIYSLDMQAPTASNVPTDIVRDALVDTSTVIDSSRFVTQSINFTNKSWDIIPGTIENGPYMTPADTELSGSNTGSIGTFYPNHGMLVLAGSKMDSDFGFETNRNIEVDGLNALRLYESLTSSAIEGDTDASGDPLAFWGRFAEKKYNTMYFVRVKNQIFNFSNNPTFTSGSEGVILDTLANQERAYFTSIGLYNNTKELLAVGKISNPMISACNKERLFKVKVGH